jgi:hypothetical protein
MTRFFCGQELNRSFRPGNAYGSHFLPGHNGRKKVE